MLSVVEKFDSFYAEVVCTCKQSVYLRVEGLENFIIKAVNCYAKPGEKVLASVRRIYGSTIHVSIDSVLYAVAV